MTHADLATSHGPGRVRSAPQPPSVLLVNPSADLYGSDRMLLEALKGTVEHGWRTVLTTSVDGPLRPVAEAAGAQVVVCPAPVLRKSNLSPGGFLQLLRSVGRGVGPMYRTLREADPDVVYINTVSVPFWGLLARAAGRPVVMHVHEAETSVPRLARRALGLPLHLAHLLIFNSETSRAAARLHRRRLRRSRVIYNGVRGPVRVVEAREEIAHPRLAYIGRLSPRKGVDVAINAMVALRDQSVDSSLVVIGDTFPGYEWYEAELRELVRANGLEDRVSFTGFLEDVYPTLEGIDVVVVPSRAEESFGNVVIEGAMAGRPVIASDHTGLREAMQHLRSALPVRPDDPIALAETVKTVVQRWPELRGWAWEDASAVQRRYAPATFQEAVRRILHEVAEQTGSPSLLADRV